MNLRRFHFNQQGDPSVLDGKSLYTQNCESCHGNDAEGVAGIFPPLVNSRWVTGDKDIPIRTLFHGLEDEIEVQGQTYRGIMPSFRARLSAAEITQSDVIQIGKKYSDRTEPWTAEELRSN
jgi:mono/diheme cytochrome c family protein